MDEVAVDSVGFDFLSQQWADLALGNEGVQDYLHEMALANQPPSGTFYDPEHDGLAMASQGVHEHWNNATNKQYTRNLGTGNGIELKYITGAPAANPNANGYADQHANGHPHQHANGYPHKHANGHADQYADGHAD